jgi:MYND finger/Sel1 repeat
MAELSVLGLELQTLRMEIRTLRMELKKLPCRADCDETNLGARRELQRKLEIAEFRCAEVEETQRIEDVKRRAMDLGMLVSRECVEIDRYCPLCLESIPLVRLIHVICCCGRIRCHRCYQRQTDVAETSICPFCRFDLEKDDVDEHLLSNAREGKTWAQFLVAKQIQIGGGGFGKDHLQAQEWYTLAADQGDAHAMQALADMWQMGFPEAIPPLPTNQELADEYVASAAKNGSAEGQYRMAHRNESSSYEHTIFDEIAMIWYTLSAAQGYHLAQCALGEAYMFGRFVEENAFKSIYWVRKAAIQGWGPAQAFLVAQLPRTKALTYDGQFDVAGYSAIPEACFWYDECTKNVDKCHQKPKWLQVVQCGCCGKSGKEQKLRRCKRCKSSGYCDTECQRKHWETGHKRDCNGVYQWRKALKDNSPHDE